MSKIDISELFQIIETNYNLRTSDFVIPRYNTCLNYGKLSIREAYLLV